MHMGPVAAEVKAERISIVSIKYMVITNADKHMSPNLSRTCRSTYQSLQKSLADVLYFAPYKAAAGLQHRSHSRDTRHYQNKQ
jgi:hypothetical protein